MPHLWRVRTVNSLTRKFNVRLGLSGVRMVSTSDPKYTETHGLHIHIMRHFRTWHCKGSTSYQAHSCHDFDVGVIVRCCVYSPSCIQTPWCRNHRTGVRIRPFAELSAQTSKSRIVLGSSRELPHPASPCPQMRPKTSHCTHAPPSESVWSTNSSP